MNDHYTCGLCGNEYPNRDAYVEHLADLHPDTWLAKRAKYETERREKRNANHQK